MARRNAASDKEWSVDKAPELPLPADLARVLGWLRGHLSEPIDLERLASVASVRPRTAGNTFQGVPGHDAARMGAQDAPGPRPPGTGTRSCRCDCDRCRPGKRLHAIRSLRCQLPCGLRRGTFEHPPAQPGRAGRRERDRRRGFPSHLAGDAATFLRLPRGNAARRSRTSRAFAKKRRAMVCRSHSPPGVGRNAPRMDSARLRGMIAIMRCGWLQRPARWRRTTPWL